MKVKELIDLLSKQDPEKEVMIQQGDEYEYMIAYSVKEMDLVEWDHDNVITVVVIEYY